MKNIAVIGASGGIGRAFVETVCARYSGKGARPVIYAFSRGGTDFKNEYIHNLPIDVTDERSISEAADAIDGTLDIVFIATGFLHAEDVGPEKSIRDLNAEGFARNFAVNTAGPALVGKYFLPLLNTQDRAVFAALSARVGSVSDNRAGGWYSYRASKAALNMVLKNFAIEMGRRHKNLIIAGLQPGTVDTALSKPFQGGVAEDKLFSPDFAAAKLLDVLEALTPQQSGQLFDWSGERFDP